MVQDCSFLNYLAWQEEPVAGTVLTKEGSLISGYQVEV